MSPRVENKAKKIHHLARPIWAVRTWDDSDEVGDMTLFNGHRAAYVYASRVIEAEAAQLQRVEQNEETGEGRMVPVPIPHAISHLASGYEKFRRLRAWMEERHTYPHVAVVDYIVWTDGREPSI